VKVSARAQLEAERLDRLRTVLNPKPGQEPGEVRRDDLEWLVAAYATLRYRAEKMAVAIGWEQG
jgi:hypothetical protein